MPHRGTESDFELTTIERLEQLGYTYVHGPDLDRPLDEVVLTDRLRAHLELRYPDLPDASLEEAVRRFSRPDGVDTLRRNRSFQKMLTRGLDDLRVEHEDGKTEYRHVHAIDWDNPESNDFLVVNQLTVQGKNTRRPDILLFVNGLPLVVFELKNPWDDKPRVEHAYTQVQHYAIDIPQLFEYNAVTVISDGAQTLHGVWTAGREWFAPWKSIDGETTEPGTTGGMKTLVEGLLPKERLLDYVRHFLVFESANDKITKKGAKYHQFFAVRKAAERTLAAAAEQDKRIGVIWHTTGSGKSLSMAFLVGMLRRRPELANPTFVVEVDRTDLDNQLHDQFVLARDVVGAVKQADSVPDLRNLLRTEGGEVIFTTIEKFQLKTDAEGNLELEHPVLSERRNVIVIADEAHRSQYGFKQGYARYLAEALPNAMRLGFTGTPISFSGADTVEVFGQMIHTYDIRQSQEDGMTVPIYYEPRQVQLRLSEGDIDAALTELVSGVNEDELARKKSRWAALAKAAGATDRLNSLARDLLEHFRERNATLEGKAMIVCMTRENCVRLYDALTALDGCPEAAVIMTGNISTDPPEWNGAGHISTKLKREALKKRMVDPDDPLKFAIVCDMWLTGTDIPCLHTLYVDKPMKGHNMIQAISRVNRVFGDKPHGLVVDYIGIGDELREATATYASGKGRGEPASDVSETAKPVFQELLREIRGILPGEIDYGDWRRLSRIAMEDRYSLVLGHLTEFGTHRHKHFLGVEHRLSNAFLLVKHLDDCRPYADEMIFVQRVRKQLMTALKDEAPKTELELERAVRDLVDDTVESEGVVDLFELAGVEKADISVLDDEFLQTFKDRPLPNLRLKLLEKIVRAEIKKRRPRNLATAESFRKLLEKTLEKYHNRLVDAAAVIQAMIEIRKGMESEDRRAEDIGLEAEELAFYDAVESRLGDIYDQPFLKDLVHDVVKTVKANLKVDWTADHRQDIRAGVRAAVKRVLRKKKVKPETFDFIIPRVMEQAEAMYRDWPVAV